MDESTDKLRDHVCDKGWEGVKKSEIFMDVIDGSPLIVTCPSRTELGRHRTETNLRQHAVSNPHGQFGHPVIELSVDVRKAS